MSSGSVKRKFIGILAVGLILALGVSAASAQDQAPADATQALLGAFNNYSIVAVDDAMIIQQAADFYTSLVTNPMFAANVGNVVIDFGNSADQSTVDNYLAGQGSDSDLAQIWVATGFGGGGFGGRGGANGGATGGAAATPQVVAVPQSYTSFLAAIRTANQSLPDNQKIHVWLGGQVVQRGGGTGGAAATQQAPSGGNNGGNGGTGGGRGGFGGGFGGGQFIANLIETQILSQNKKALVIANIAQFNPNGITFGGFGGRGRGNGGSGNGSGAASTQQAPQGNFTPPQDARQILEKDYPGKTIVAVVHRGMQEADCNTNLEGIMTSWKAPVVASIKGTALQTALTAQNCHELGSFGQASINEGWADGYLYLGPVASLTISPAAGQQAMSYLDYVKQMQQQIQQFLQQNQAQATQPPAST